MKHHPNFFFRSEVLSPRIGFTAVRPDLPNCSCIPKRLHRSLLLASAVAHILLLGSIAAGIGSLRPEHGFSADKYLRPYVLPRMPPRI